MTDTPHSIHTGSPTQIEYPIGVSDLIQGMPQITIR